jgi:hypothetical protein
VTYPVLTALDGQLTDNQLADIRAALDGIAEHAEQYETAREYDSTNLWEADENSREGRLLRQAGAEFDPNYCGPVINNIADGMIIDGIMATRDPEAMDDDELPEEDDEATALVNNIWDAQKLGQFYPSWQRNGLRDGDAYLMLWFTADAEVTFELGDASTGASLSPEQLNITYMDPTVSRLFYDRENPRVKSFFAWCWEKAAPGDSDGRRVVWRLNLMYADRIERFETPPRSKDKAPRAEDFQLYVPDGGDDDDPDEADGWKIPNPFGQVTAFHLRTDVEYGKPVHLNAYGPQDNIGETIERMMTTMAFQSWPQTYALQEAENMAQQSIREDPLDEDYNDGLGDFDDDTDRDRARDGSDISNETGTDLEATPGGMMVLKGFKTVSQLETADPAVFLEPWREFAKAVADTTGTPPWAFRAVGGEIPSGIALKIALQPQTARRSRSALLFGAEVADLLAASAAACGMPDVTVTIQWAPFEPIDETERWTLVKLRTDAGVPLEQALIMAGIPARQAREWAEQKKLDAEEEFQRQQTLAAKQPVEDKPPPGE